jgi:hypothetical protein
VRPSLFSEGARSFIECALAPSARRWTAEQLIQHPWLRGRVAEFERVYGPVWLGPGAAAAAAAAAGAAVAGAAGGRGMQEA